MRNGYTVKLLNKSGVPHAFELKAEGADVNLTIIGGEPGKPVTVPADGSEAVRVAVTMAHPANGSIRFVARDLAGKQEFSAVDRFVAP